LISFGSLNLMGTAYIQAHGISQSESGTQRYPNNFPFQITTCVKSQEIFFTL
jgi:hypothetical protein